MSFACLAWRMQAREDRRDPPLVEHPRVAVIEAGGPPHASTPLFDVGLRPEVETVVIGANAPFDELLASVADARPTHLVGYASEIGRLARAALDGQLEIQPVRVSTNSEPLSDEDREAIDRAWSAPVHNLWGSTEIGVHAAGCGRGDGLHICEDEVIIERVDADGSPVGPDEPAARTLGDRAREPHFPVHPLRPRRPGEPAERVVPLRQRAGTRRRHRRTPRTTTSATATTTIPAAAFRHVLGTDPAISEYQVRQTAGGADVLVVGSPDRAAVQRSLAVGLARFGLTDPSINVIKVEQIERHAATGKLKRFVPS